MATVFTFNEQSLKFFYKNGFEIDDYSPKETSQKDYLILSRKIQL